VLSGGRGFEVNKGKEEDPMLKEGALQGPKTTGMK